MVVKDQEKNEVDAFVIRAVQLLALGLSVKFSRHVEIGLPCLVQGQRLLSLRWEISAYTNNANFMRVSSAERRMVLFLTYRIVAGGWRRVYVTKERYRGGSTGQTTENTCGENPQNKDLVCVKAETSSRKSDDTLRGDPDTTIVMLYVCDSHTNRAQLEFYLEATAMPMNAETTSKGIEVE